MAEPTSTLWPLQPHTRGKHLVLERYLHAWLPILGSWSGRILFIDAFAGPGEYAGGEPGSPIIALNAFRQHKLRSVVTGEVVFFFIEKDPARALHLSGLVERLKPSMPDNCHAYVENGAFDATMTRVLDGIDAGKSRLAPALVMVDPFGVSETPMAVLRRILGNPRSEVYVSFMYEAMNRFCTTEEFEPHLDSLFGCQDWRDGRSIEEPSARKAFFYGLYENQLREAGAQQVVRFELYQGNRLIYAIVFATRSTTGSDRMKEAIWKVAPFGDFAFRGSRTSQLGLDLQQPDFRPLQRLLCTEFGSEGYVTIEQVEDFVKSDRTDYYLSQLRRHALIPLEKSGVIEVDPGTRKKRNTYPKGTRLRFRS